MTRRRAMAVFLLVISLAAGLQAQQATVQEESKLFKTYPFSGPDPAPIMTRSSMWGKGPRLYPYFFFDNLSYTGANQAWNVVRMENPYIQVMVLPAEGGKLIGAVEKGTQKQFIYFNQVRKFRQIALRGPWTSGGIELNFGIDGHTPATAMPVDYFLRNNPDGSVSCFVGAMDLPSRTQWRAPLSAIVGAAVLHSAAVPVLTYHSMKVSGTSHADNDHVAFAEDLERIHRLGLRIVPAGEVARACIEGRLDGLRGCVALTMDDGPDFDARDLPHPVWGVQRGMLGILEDFRARHGAQAQPGLHATSFVIVSPQAREELDRHDMIGCGVERPLVARSGGHRPDGDRKPFLGPQPAIARADGGRRAAGYVRAFLRG